MTEPHGQIMGGHTDGNGGGIYVENGGELRWQSGNLTNNSANGKGGGVYLEEQAHFEMSGGYIYFNHAEEAGGGVYANADVSILENGIIKDNFLSNSGKANKLDNLYLATGKKINVSKALAEDTLIYVTTETKPTDGNPVVIVEGTNLVASRFVSDDEQYETALENNKIVLKALPAPHKHALNIGCDGNITAGGTEIEFDKKLST